MSKPKYKVGQIVRVTVAGYSALNKIIGYTTWQRAFAYETSEPNGGIGIVLPTEILSVTDSEAMLWMLEN